jgi:hypothetical protein
MEMRRLSSDVGPGNPGGDSPLSPAARPADEDPGQPADAEEAPPKRLWNQWAAARTILTVYWLISGYGLRGWRALASLVVTLVALTLLLDYTGTHPHPPLAAALFYSAETTLSLAGATPADSQAVHLILPGEVIRILLRLLGPLLIGLAILSVRNRIKR